MALRTSLAAVLVTLAATAPARAWHTEGHRRVATDAVRLLPAEVPAFFRAGALAVGHGAVDPDTWKSRDMPQLRDEESPNHYLDQEYLEGQDLPDLRSEYEALLGRMGLAGSQVGYLPYAVVEATQRLTVAFAEHRRWPRNRHIRAKTLFYAGWLAHYAADLCQPLHTTVHHDGRARADLSTPHSGIHEKVDGLFERVAFGRAEAVRGVELRRFEDLQGAVRSELAASHALVDRVYELEGALDDDAGSDPRVRAFTRERYRETAGFVASLLWTAWLDSASVEVPPWLDRQGY